MNHSQTRFILSLISFDNFIYQHFYFWKLLGLDLTILLNSSCLATQTFSPERIRKIYSSSCSSSLFSFFPTSQFCLIPSLLLRGSSLPFLLLHLILSQPGPLSIDHLCHAAAFCPERLKNFGICTASLVLTAGLIVEKQSFFNLLGQNGRHLTKVFTWRHVLHVGVPKQCSKWRPYWGAKTIYWNSFLM